MFVKVNGQMVQNSMYMRFGQFDSQSIFFTAKINNIHSRDGEMLVEAQILGDVIEFSQNFPTEPKASGYTYARVPARDVFFHVEADPLSILGQIQKQGILQEKAVPDIPFRLGQGDRIVAKIPNCDTIQYFSSLAVTSSDGFLFRPEVNSGYTSPILVSLQIGQEYNLGLDQSFATTSISINPRGDVLWEAGNQIRYHQMSTATPLRSGSISLELRPRNNSQAQKCKLGPRGSMSVTVAFFKRG